MEDPKNLSDSLVNSLGHSVLILGDGNFSFANALAKRIFTDDDPCKVESRKLIATDILSEEEFRIRSKNHASHKCLQLKFGVDATKLQSDDWKRGEFTDIVMNFPHHGNKMSIKYCRTLLRNIFKSLVSTLMALKSTRFHLTLTRLQTGIDCFEKSDSSVPHLPLCSSDPPKFQVDSWQPIQIAAELGLIAEYIRDFDPNSFEGYVPSGNLGPGKAFLVATEAQTITFILSHRPFDSIKRYDLLILKKLEFNEGRHEVLSEQIHRENGTISLAPLPYHRLRPIFQCDISVLFPPIWHLTNDDIFKCAEELLRILVYHFAGPTVVEMFELVEKRALFQDHPNRIYRLCWQGWALALHRTLVNQLHAMLCQKLALFLMKIQSQITLSGYQIVSEEALDRFEFKKLNIKHTKIHELLDGC